MDETVEIVRHGPTIRYHPVVAHAGILGQPCYTAVLIAAGDVLSRFRILVPVAAGGPVGSADMEGDMPHWTEARTVPNPDGTRRWLMSWHDAGACEIVANGLAAKAGLT